MIEKYISLYHGVKDSHSTQRIAVSEMLQRIKSGYYRQAVLAIGGQRDKKKRNALKSRLDAVTWSGCFEPRLLEHLQQHSGILCIDIDELGHSLQSVKEKLCEDPLVFSCFVSPSGNGLKILFLIDMPAGVLESEDEIQTCNELHYNYFRAIADYLQRVYALAADESGKDSTRLCFASWDIALYQNNLAQIVNAETLQLWQGATPSNPEKKRKKETKKKNAAPAASNNVLDDVATFTNNIKSYVPGKRNAYINTFAMNAKHKGIDAEEVKLYAQSNFSDYEDGGLKAVNKIIESVYANPKIEFGKFSKKSFKGPLKSEANPEKKNAAGYVEEVVFWDEIEKEDKDTGEFYTEYKFNHDGLTYFLANNGYKKIKMGDKGYQYIRVQDNKLESMEPDDITGYVLSYLEKDVRANDKGIYTIDAVHDALQPVRKMYKRGINSYSKPTSYASLPFIEPTVLRDKKEVSYLYFKNGFLEINEKGYQLHNYQELTGHVWTKQIKDFDFTPLPISEIEASDTYKFIHYAVVGEQDDYSKEDKTRFLSMLTTIGYMVDGYKDPLNAKAIIFADRKINTTGNESNGGSGKTLFTRMMNYILHVCSIDGKDLSFDSPYPFDKLKPDHRLIVLNDVQKKFPFDRLFPKVTEDFEYRKKYVDSITIPFEDSPKIVVTTNYSILGEGSSYRRRQQYVEFTDYFNDTRQPKDVLQRALFFDWDKEEWNRFYNFFAYCVQQYKIYGLIPFPSINRQTNKLIQAAGETFVDWMNARFIGDETEQAIYPLNARLEQGKIFEAFINECRDYANMRNSNSFTTWVRMWADMNDFEINKHKNCGKDKSGGTYFWTFTKREK